MERQLTQLKAALSQYLLGAPLSIPEHGRLAWRWFVDLHMGRTYRGSVPDPISYSEIEAYGRLMRWDFMPRHVDLIRALDNVWLAHIRSGPAEPKRSRKPSGAITPALFDAVFG